MEGRKAQLKMLIVLISIILATSAWAQGPIQKPGGKVIKLKFNTFLGPSHFTVPLSKAYIRDLEEKSGGRVKVDYFDGEALGKAKEEWEVVKSGIADMVTFCSVYTPERFPLTLLLELPFASPSAYVSTEVEWRLFEKGLIASEFAENKLLVPSCTSPAQLFTNRKVTKVKDFKGLKVMALGPGLADTWRRLGAVPVEITSPDSYLALQRGTIDATVSSWSGAPAWKWQEVVKHAVDINIISGWACGRAMNLQKWNELPKDLQEVFTRVSGEYRMRFAKAYDEMDAKYREVFKQAGVEVYPFPSEERAKLAALLMPVWEKWINDNEAKGRPAKKVYKAYCEIMKELGQEVQMKLPGLYE